MLLVTYVLGVDVGLIGSSKLSAGLHANFFNAFPLDDNYINAGEHSSFFSLPPISLYVSHPLDLVGAVSSSYSICIPSAT